MSGERDAYIERLKVQLDEWNAELDRMEAQAKKAQADVRTEYERQMDELRKERDKYEATLNQMMTASDDAWRDLRDSMEKAWDELRKGMRQAHERFNK